MLRPDVESELMESRQVVLVLRLTLNRDSQLLYGELLNAEGFGQGRFADLASMSTTVKQWLGRQQVGGFQEPEKSS